MGKILPISLKLNFTPNTLSGYALSWMPCASSWLGNTRWKKEVEERGEI